MGLGAADGSRMSNPTEKKIDVTEVIPGYAHTKFRGTYSGPVTRDDIKERFKNPYFGGRWGHFGGGRFEYIRHDD